MTEVSLPPFKFRTLSSHNDALSRQLMEAIMIREKGNLNKKSEHALMSLLGSRLASTPGKQNKIRWRIGFKKETLRRGF